MTNPRKWTAPKTCAHCGTTFERGRESVPDYGRMRYCGHSCAALANRRPKASGPCSTEGCGAEQYCRGWCRRCYMRDYRRV